VLTDPQSYLGFASLTATAALSDWLQQVIPQVDRAIRNELGRDVLEKQAGVVEYLAGSGNEVLLLTHTPVQSITEVRVDSAGYAGQGTGFGAATVLTAGVDYYLAPDDPLNNWSRAGMLVRIGSVWPRRSVRYAGQLSGSAAPGLANVKVTYSAGFTADASTPPADLQLAANLVLSQLRAAAKLGQVMQTERLGEYQYQLQPQQLGQAIRAASVEGVLQKYRVLRL
jgi:hypothetical protein